MKIFLDSFAKMPTRAHETDAGLDLCSPKRVFIWPRSSVAIDTGVHIELPKGTAGLLVAKSGLNVKHNITSTGLIDEGYRGSIVAKLYNDSDEPYIVEEGDKISQLVVIPVLYEAVEIVDTWSNDTSRGTRGFGSSGR